MYLAVGLNLGLKFWKFHVLDVSNDLFEPWPFLGEPFLFELAQKKHTQQRFISFANGSGVFLGI